MKNLIFDVNVIVGYWLKERSSSSTAQLLDGAQAAGAQLWLVVASLPTLAYVARTAFKRCGLPPEAVAQQVVPKLRQELLREVGVLTNHGCPYLLLRPH